MAGAGYKLFNTGDVLTAAQVNTYLQEQTVMVFADAAARTTALSGVLSEGMITYLKSTDAVEVYNGSAWVGVAGASSPLTTKGDLYTYSTTNARLAVGNNGETLVPDSTTSTGLRWQPSFAAGKNVILNGDFNIWQRGTSISVGGAWTYTTDRWRSYMASGTATVSRQAFTPGTAPVAGYEGIYFMRHTAPASGGQLHFRQSIENVQTFAGQTVTLSFWAKASTNLTLNARFGQYFGSGGSADVNTSDVAHSITTSWTRFTQTVSIPSISGKTIGANNLVEPYFTTAASFTSSATLDIWGVQVEAGSVATAFQTATGTLAGELAACQRYYMRFTEGSAASYIAAGNSTSTTAGYVLVHLPVTMRIEPATLDYANLRVTDLVGTGPFTALTIESAASGPNRVLIGYTGATSQTQYRSIYLQNDNSTTAYLGLSAEL